MRVAPQKELPGWLITALIAWAVLVSTLITGYLGNQGYTHNFSLILVHRLNQPTLYPNDPFAETAPSYASVYWYAVAWLNRWLELEWILVVLFVATRAALVVAIYQLATVLFPRSWGASVAALLAIAAVPNPIVGEGSPIRNFSEQTNLAVVALLFSLIKFLQRRWALSMVWLGTAFSLNLMYAVFGVLYLLATGIASQEYRSAWRDWTRAIPLALIVGLPGILLVLRAAAQPVSDWTAVWQTAELTFTGHFFMVSYPAWRHLLTVGLIVATITASFATESIETRMRAVVRWWTAAGLFWYLLAWLTPTWLPSISLLRLHPVRGHDLWVILAITFLAGSVGQRIETLATRSGVAFIREFTLLNAILLWHHVGAGLVRRVLLILVAVLIGAGAVLIFHYRRRVLENPFAFATAVFAATAFGFTLAGIVRFATVGQGQLGMEDEHTVARFAQWAQEHTSPDSVFLVPLCRMAASLAPSDIFGKPNPRVRWENFRHLAQRSVFVSWHDGGAWPYAPYYCAHWLERMRAIGFVQAAGLDTRTYRIGTWTLPPARAFEICEQVYHQLDDSRVNRLREKYRLDYWIAPARVPSNFPEVFRYGGWKVLRLSSGANARQALTVTPSQSSVVEKAASSSAQARREPPL